MFMSKYLRFDIFSLNVRKGSHYYSYVIDFPGGIFMGTDLLLSR